MTYAISQQVNPPAFQEPEFTRTQFYLYTLVHLGTETMDRINLCCAVAPWPIVLAVVGAFAALCVSPYDATAAALVAALMWWFLVMTLGRYILRSIVAAALVFEICRLLASTSFLPNPFKI
jgi:hypothetical protein